MSAKTEAVKREALHVQAVEKEKHDAIAHLKDYVTLNDFQVTAAKKLDRNAWDYYRSGADAMQTLAENEKAFLRLRIRPRVLTNVSSVNTSTSILGSGIASPICVAPTAMQRMATPLGEIATAKAAAAFNTCMMLSSWSTTNVEDVAAAAPDAVRWFQLYVYKDREMTLSIIRRAEKCGYKALALTVDTPQLGRREADVRNKFKLPSHLSLANFVGAQSNVAEAAANRVGQSDGGSGLQEYVTSMIDSSLCWEDVKWLKSVTKLPLVLKGILTGEDAELAVANGVDGIIVSNHGARQLDGVPATIEALPEVVAAVKGQIEVYLDGGVRRGTDVLKALALGARAVFIGRPLLWGLAVDGENGARAVLKVINDEFKLAMLLAGCRRPGEISKAHVGTALSYRAKL